MDSITSVIQNITGLNPAIQTKVAISGLIIMTLLLTRAIILRIVWRQTNDVRTRFVWQRTLSYTVFTLALLFVSRVWYKGFQSLATFLGLFSAGVAIALKDMITNIAAWFFIIIRRPLTLGDRIQIGNHAGDVIDIRLMQFTLLEIGNWVQADQSTGRIIHIPNGKIFSDALANYSKGFQYIWNEIPVLITFESNWQKAKEVLQKIVEENAQHLSKAAEMRVREATKQFMIFYNVLTPTVYTAVKDSGVLLTLRYLCEPQKRRNSEQAMWECVLKEFSKHEDIEFAYPTQRFFHNPSDTINIDTTPGQP